MQTSTPIGPILVPVDFSPYSAAALVWAARLAEKLTLPLRVLHVVHDPASDPGYYRQASSDDQLGRVEEAAAEMMTEFITTVASEHPDCAGLDQIDPILVPGLPVTRVLEVAEELGAAMIVVGSQGRTGLDRLMLGSKAERIAQLSPIPVTIVKRPEPASGEGSS